MSRNSLVAYLVCTLLLLGCGICLAQVTDSTPRANVSVPEARLLSPARVIPFAASKLRRHSLFRSGIGLKAPRITLPALNSDQLREDRRNRALEQSPSSANTLDLARDPRRPRRHEVGIVRPLQVTQADGQWLTQSDGTRAWVLELASPGAVIVRVHLVSFALPTGMTLLVGAPDGDVEPEEFVAHGPFPDGDFWTPPVDGDTVRLVIIEETPTQSSGATTFQVVAVGHVYEDLRDSFTGEPAPCELDAMCYPEWNSAGNSVVRMLFSDPNYFYACSGTLVNNLSGDYSPLLLTATHCIDTEALARTVTAYFFYTTKFCGVVPGTDVTPKFSSYATFLASTPIDDSDASLIELTNPLPVGVTWASWTTSALDPGAAVTAIHHPVAASRRISFGTRVGDVTTGRYGVSWSQGITEHGSSGGPLFNANHEIVGQLHGGYSSCAVAGPDSFGKLSVSYPLLADASGRKYLEQGLPDDNLANNSRDHAYSVTVPSTLEHLVVKAKADDWFKLSIPAGQGFFVSATGDINNPSGGAGPTLEVFKNDDTIPTYVARAPATAYVGAFGGAADFFVHISTYSDANVSAVRTPYSISFTAWQPTMSEPKLSSGISSTTHNAAITGGWLYMEGNPPMTWWYEWGTDATLSNHFNTPYVSSTSLQTQTIADLTPATQYYSRLAVQWQGGTLYGNVVPFQTKAVGAIDFYPQDGSVGNGTNGPLSFQAYGSSVDIYYGDQDQPPLLGTYIPDSSNNSVSVYPPIRKPSTRYYWRVVTKYQGVETSSPPFTFDTQMAIKANTGVLSFAPVMVSKNSAEQTITISNWYLFYDLHITSVNVTGSFTQWNDCVGNMVGHWTPPGSYSTCTIHVTSRPVSLGNNTGTLTILTETYPLPLAVQLTGTGIPLVFTLDRPARPARSGTSASASSVELPLPAFAATSTTCNVSSRQLTCSLLRRDATSLIVLAPRRKRRRLRRAAEIPAGYYVLSVVGGRGGSSWEIPIEVR